jgi:hypothetical protein
MADPGATDKDTAWLDPIYDPADPTNQEKVSMPTAELGYTPPRFRMRHIITETSNIQGGWAAGASAGTLVGGLVFMPGFAQDITFDKYEHFFKWMVYEGDDPFHPDYVYIRQKVTIRVTVQTDSMGIGGVSINNAASIPEQREIKTYVINNAPTEFYERDPDVTDPPEWVADPNNKVYRYTTFNHNQDTPFAEEGAFFDYIGDYNGGGGTFLFHYYGVWYDIQVPASAKLYCPDNNLWDQWQVPTPINPNRIQFQFEIGVPEGDGIVTNTARLVTATKDSSRIIIKTSSEEGLPKEIYAFEDSSNPSVDYDKRGWVRIGLKKKTGYYEYISKDGGYSFQSLGRIWAKEYKNEKYIFLKDVNVGASVALTGKRLEFKRTDKEASILIADLSAASPFGLIYRQGTGILEVSNTNGIRFHSKDFGLTWQRSDRTTTMSGTMPPTALKSMMGKPLFIKNSGIIVILSLNGKVLELRRSDREAPIIINSDAKSSEYFLLYHENTSILEARSKEGFCCFSNNLGLTWYNPDGTLTQ